MNYQDRFDSSVAENLSAARLRDIAVKCQVNAVPPHERWRMLRRSWRPLAYWTLACVTLALAYCLFSTPKFLVTTDVVLEPRQSILSADPAAQPAAPTLDSALADSQVQVLTSERNLRHVFDVHHLENDPEFAESGFDPIGWILDRVPFLSQPPLPPDEQAKRTRQMAFERFANQVSVKRLAQSYAFELSFYASNPVKAARLGNAITAAYIRDRVLYNIAVAAAQRGGDFLQNRAADTKAEQEATAEAVRTGTIPDYVFVHADSRVVSSALPPLKKTYPKTTLILVLATAFGLISGAIGVIVSDELDRRVRSTRRLRTLTGLTAMASIPFVKTRKSHVSALLHWARWMPESLFAAELRKLRSAALQFAEAHESPMIGVLSYQRGEGRSTVAANLASLIAEAGTPVTLVDGDALRPRLTTAFAPQPQSLGPGTIEANVDPRALLENVAQNLSILPACSVWPGLDVTEAAYGRMTTAACVVLSESRLVLVDLPPIMDPTGGLATARSLACVIVVVGANGLKIEEFQELLDHLAEGDVRVLGIVLNKAELT